MLSLRLDDTKERANITLSGYEFDRMVSPYVYEELLEKDSGGLVKMKRLPDETNFLALIQSRAVNCNMIERITTAVSQMHKLVENILCKRKLTGDDYLLIFNENVSRIKAELEFVEEKQFIDRIYSVIDKCIKVVKSYESIVESRYSKSYVHLLHGDLHAGNLFVDESNVYITDSVFPIEHWQYGDYGVDLAAFAMDLDAYGYSTYSQVFVSKYAEECQDETLSNVCLLYKLNWALIRFVVNLQGNRVRNEKPSGYKRYLSLIETYLG